MHNGIFLAQRQWQRHSSVISIRTTNTFGKIMAKTSPKNKTKQPADAVTKLKQICELLKTATSPVETQHYQHHLEVLALECILNHSQALEGFIQTLSESGPPQGNADAYGPMFEAIRTLSECATLFHDDREMQFLLIAAPVTCHSSAGLPKTLSAAVTKKINLVFARHIAGAHTVHGFLPGLYGEDELPFSPLTRRTLIQNLATSVLEETQLTRDDLNEVSDPFFDDVGDLSQRFLIGIIGVAVTPERRNPGLFRWNSTESETINIDFAAQAAVKITAAEGWSKGLMEVLSTIVPSARLETAIPAGASHAMNVAASRARPHQLMALLRMVASFTHCDMAALSVSVAPFGENYPLEYRIGILDETGNDVIDGMTWQVSSFDPTVAENLEESPDVIARNAITSCLKMVGCTHIYEITELSSFEDCDDCGSPLYLNRHQELCHPTHDAREAKPHSH